MKYQNARAKTERVRQIGEEYNLRLVKLCLKGEPVSSLLVFESRNLGDVFDPASDFKELNDDERFILGINLLLNCLPEMQCKIIWNDYFLLVKDKNWWTSRCCRSAYYHSKTVAVDKFLEFYKKSSLNA